MSTSPASVEEISDPYQGLTSREREPDTRTCQSSVLVVFEDICPNHLDQLAEQHGFSSEAIIATILDQQEKGHQYPRRENPKKRKRGDDKDDAPGQTGKNDIKSKLDDPEYVLRMRTQTYQHFATTLISQDFPKVPVNTIKNMLNTSASLFQAYTTIDDSIRRWDDNNPPWKNKRSMSKILDQYTPDNISTLQMDLLGPVERDAISEFMAAREVRNGKNAKLAEEAEEVSNLERSRMLGEMAECGCCFDDCPINRMVHCEGDTVHWFCRGCAKQQAETIIGYSKYKLTCMSMDNCEAGFSISQRKKFLDNKLQTALDRNEQAEVLREAGIENLETCPFCPFAMEYPTVEENKEFRCANPECEVVSCRLCRKETHIPKTCDEAKLEEGHSARHTIEEAMSEAVIRKCNKCSNPFIKQDGCNKITCTRCRTIQCYVCRQTVKDYSHFNDTSRGGKEGQCPLFDATEERHQNEVRRAEEEMRQKVAQENPDVDNVFLEFKVSEKVKEDDQKRKERDPRFHHRAAFAHVMAHARQVRQDLQAQAQAAVHAGAAPLLFEARPPGMRPLGPPPPAHQPHDEVNLPKHWAERRERRYAKLHEIEVKMREMREGPRRRLANPAKPPDPNPQSNLHRTQSAPERVLGNLNPQPAPFQHAQVEAALRNGDVFFGMQNADLPAIVPFSNVNNFQGFPEVRLFGLLNDGPYGQEDDPWMEEMRRSVADIRRNIAQRVQIPEMPQMPQMPQMPHLQHMPPIPQIPMVGVGPRPPVPVRAHHPHRVEIRNRAGNPQGPHAAFGRARN